MMKKIVNTLAVLFVLASVFAFTIPAFKVSPKHSIKFSTFGVSGQFRSFNGLIQFDERNLNESRFDVTIAVNSIKTSWEMQDKHAKGEDWFNAPKYPHIRFISKSIVKKGANYEAIGDLNLHGITRQVTLPFSYKPNATGGTFTGSFVINRNDFKVGEPGGMVGEEIKVNVTVPVLR